MFLLTNGDFFVPALPLFSHLLIWEFNLTQAIVEGKVHIITDAIYVVCQSGPKHQFLNMSSSLPKCSPTPRIRLHLPWLWAVTYISTAHGIQIRRIVMITPLYLGGKVAIGFLAALVVRNEILPVCKVTDLVLEGAVSQYSFKWQ